MQGWRVAFWVVAALAAITAAMIIAGVVEPRTLLPKKVSCSMTAGFACRVDCAISSQAHTLCCSRCVEVADGKAASTLGFRRPLECCGWDDGLLLAHVAGCRRPGGEYYEVPGHGADGGQHQQRHCVSVAVSGGWVQPGMFDACC